MNRAALRLIPTILAFEVLSIFLSALVSIAFAPRLLLLDDAVVAQTRPLLPWWYAAWFFVWLVCTLLIFRRRRPALRALARGASHIESHDLLEIYASPARVVLSGFFAALLVSTATLAPAFRPQASDLYTQIELVILAMTFTSVFALPLYVALRVTVTRVIELAPVQACADALQVLETTRPNLRRVEIRILAAVATPVGFVAVGASLLVHAHVRAYDSTARQAQALELIRGVIEPFAGRSFGRAEAAQKAAQAGFVVTIEPTLARAEAVRDEEGGTRLTVLFEREQAHAVVRFDTPLFSGSTVIYGILAGLAIVLAGALGKRLAAVYGKDVRMATRELLTMGALDVLRGTNVERETKFASVQELMRAIDELGGVFRDFAGAQERAIEARAAAERMRGLFLASMSHDLKTPLNAILGFAELVSRERLTDGQRESITIIEQRGRELLYLIETILDAARAEAGELTISPEWAMVGDVIMPAVRDARELSQDSEVEFIAEIQPGMPRLFVDVARIAQALTAVILVGARSVNRGAVVVRATLPSTGDMLCVDVETSGPALPSVDQNRIFDSFKHSEHARQHGSLGLGPWLARTILEMHRGSILVSQAEGGGTLFRVWIPTERVSLRALAQG